MTEEALVALSWIRAFELVSLDILKDALPLMGLSQSGRVRELSRKVLGAPRRYGSSENVRAFFTEQLWPEFEAYRVADPGGGNTLKFWIEDIFMDEESPWHAYEGAFQLWLRTYRTAPELGYDAARIGRIYQQYRETTNTDDVKELLDRLKTALLTDWDTAYYSIEGVDPSINWYPHFDKTELCVGANRFQVFWEQARPLFTTSDYAAMDIFAADDLANQGFASISAAQLRRRI